MKTPESEPAEPDVESARKLRPILVTGSHRSGTTWVGEMINASGQTGYIYEPFNPVLERTGLCVAPFRGFTYIHQGNETLFEVPIARTLSFQYDGLEALRTLDGVRGSRKRLREWQRTRRFGRQRLRPLMKDPIAVFSVDWLVAKYQMDAVVMIRHPAAFVASIVRLGWTHDFGEFLEQPELMDDHLYPFRGEIEEFARSVQPVADQAALAWKLIHHMILGYRDRHTDWLFVRHEDLALDPLAGFAQMYEAFGLEMGSAARSTILEHSRSGNDAQAPSGVATHLKRDSAASLHNWRQHLEPSDLARIRKRVEPISDEFYDSETWEPPHDG